MKINAYRQALYAMSDSAEPGVVLHMHSGRRLTGIARNQSYGPSLPKSLCWFSAMHGVETDYRDVVLDIAAIAAILPYQPGDEVAFERDMPSVVYR